MPDFAKLQSFRQRVPFCSQSALAAILTLAKEEGIPDCHKRKDIRSSVQQLVQSLQLYGPLLVTISAVTLLGESESLLFANIFSYLAGAYAAGGAFAEYLERVHTKCPSSFSKPWKCILYADELHPGNQLSSGARKTWSIYFSFAEFGKDLCKSDLWFTLLAKRSEQVAQLQANIGQCFRLILEHMFDNQFAHPHAGVLLQRGAARLKLYWTLGFFLKLCRASVIAEHIHSLETHVDFFREGCFLENVRQPTKKMMAALQSSGLLYVDSTCMCSSSCRLASGATITCGDVVYLHSACAMPFCAGQVHCFLQFSFGELALVEKYNVGDEALSTLVSKWIVPSPKHLTFVSLEEILCSVTYSSAKGKVTCLTPPYLLATQ